MIAFPSSVRVWLAAGRTDMRRGMNGLALQVQQALGRDPHAGDLYVFRGARGGLIKIIWHDGVGMLLYAKRLEKSRFTWPSPADGGVGTRPATTEDEIAAEQAAARTTNVAAFARKRPSRQPFPEHLPRKRVVEPAPVACLCCGGALLRKLGEDVTETLEVIPRSWKVIQHVREKFSCRDCEKISQPPAPFHATPRGWAGPSLLAMLVFEKFGQHQPLNRQAERYAREGVPLSLSTLAD